MQNNKVIGGVGLLLISWQPSRSDPRLVRGRVVNVFVEREVRRQGIALVFLEASLNEARSEGLQALNLGITQEGRALYTQLSFQPSESEMWLRIGG